MMANTQSKEDAVLITAIAKGWLDRTSEILGEACEASKIETSKSCHEGRYVREYREKEMQTRACNVPEDDDDPLFFVSSKLKL